MRLRIAVVYDCLYPHTIGGAERWYRDLAARLALRHDVTYLTRVQWNEGEGPDTPPGVKVIGLGPQDSLYTRSGRRRIAPPLRFGLEVFAHLMRNRRDYDVVHTCSFPYFPMLAAALVARLNGPPVVTDWIEVWSDEYWRTYLGRYAGRIGALVQNLCIRATGDALVFAESTAAMLRARGYRHAPIVLRGMFAGDAKPADVQSARQPLVVYIGRHIREKHVTAIPAAVAFAHQKVPALRAMIFGNGPERVRLLAEVARLGLQDSIDCPGFVDWTRIDEALGRAACLILPSEREGYGLVVLEAAARGTPAILVKGLYNAAADFIENGVNGYLVDTDAPNALGGAIVRACENGPALRTSTISWFREREASFSIDSSLAVIEQAYRSAAARRRAGEHSFQ